MEGPILFEDTRNRNQT